MALLLSITPGNKKKVDKRGTNGKTTSSRERQVDRVYRFGCLISKETMNIFLMFEDHVTKFTELCAMTRDNGDLSE